MEIESPLARSQVHAASPYPDPDQFCLINE
jgi:hypothetical protein